MNLDYTPAFILHTRPYKENQLLIECLVAGKGRISIVGYKGSKKNSAKTALFRPFRPLLVAYHKDSGLRTLKQVELNPSLPIQTDSLSGKCLFSGFYLNEIICRLCRADAEFDQLYPLYVYALKMLTDLSKPKPEEDTQSHLQSLLLEWVLRQFEYKLLQMLGYGVSFESDFETSTTLSSTQQYQLIADRGFTEVTYNISESQRPAYLGADLVTLSDRLDTDLQTIDYEQWDDAQLVALKRDLINAKHILRQCLQLHLGDKPIKSRELFRK